MEHILGLVVQFFFGGGWKLAIRRIGVFVVAGLVVWGVLHVKGKIDDHIEADAKAREDLETRTEERDDARVQLAASERARDSERIQAAAQIAFAQEDARREIRRARAHQRIDDAPIEDREAALSPVLRGAFSSVRDELRGRTEATSS